MLQLSLHVHRSAPNEAETIRQLARLLSNHVWVFDQRCTIDTGTWKNTCTALLLMYVVHRSQVSDELAEEPGSV